MIWNTATLIRSNRAGASGSRWTAAWLAWVLFCFLIGSSPILNADAMGCDVKDYKAGIGPTATVERDSVTIGWGQAAGTARASFVIENGQPLIRELDVRAQNGTWQTVARNLVPEFEVTSGIRRISNQQLAPLIKELHEEITPELIEREKWQAFWDAPLLVPGTTTRARPGAPGEANARNPGLPRKPEEIRRATATYDASSCRLKTDGERLEITFPGLSLGIFSGELRFTVYSGTNLLRMEAIARTDQPSVAYKYDAGLDGFSTDLTSRVAWRDTANEPQEYRFGGLRNEHRVGLKARNRILVAEGKGASIATFPPPHSFFFAREIETNLGYVWYRKDTETRFGIGVRQPDHEARGEYEQNFALYNAPPGTWQRMAVYFYLSPGTEESAREGALAFTHNDHFKPLPEYKVMVNHLHTRFTEQLRADGSLDGFTQELAALKAMGVNIVGLSDFHDDLHKYDPGPLRLQDQHDYALAAAKASDYDFLVLPWEEADSFGGHQNLAWPHNVYFTYERKPGQPLSEDIPPYGKVYHVGNAEDFQRMLDDENGYWFYAHQRTKGSTGYPDATINTPAVRNDRNLGLSFKPGMGMDLSQPRQCEWRCFDALDMMNNAIANSGLRPKYMFADIDTYRKAPEDDLYPQFPVTYLKIERLPRADQDWTPILSTMRNGQSFVTTGEVLITNYAVGGSGDQRTINADVEWTFPLEFVEIVWGEGKKVDRQLIRATDLLPFGSKHFSIPFNAAGRAWVRFSVWDSAADGAFVQPQWLWPKRTQ